MPALQIHLEGDGVWPDLLSKRHQQTQDLEIAALRGGMVSGNPSVMFRLNLPDGSVALGETSLAMLLTVADTIKARYGDPRE